MPSTMAGQGDSSKGEQDPQGPDPPGACLERQTLNHTKHKTTLQF